jgi:hypothetical protein
MITIDTDELCALVIEQAVVIRRLEKTVKELADQAAEIATSDDDPPAT